MRTSARKSPTLGQTLERFARVVTEWTGGSWAFGVAVGIIIVWGLTGPIFHFSDTWQLVINTGTTIVTFLMVFLIQRAQNKDALAIHLKLNEIVAALEGASNRLINVEKSTEDEVRTLHRYYEKLVTMARRDESLTASHSIEEAEQRHRRKRRRDVAAVVTSEVGSPATPSEIAPAPTAPVDSTGRTGPVQEESK
jgi:low affinity Fe/Cu permease